MSAVECIASESIDGLEVMAAATYLHTAIATSAANPARTTFRDEREGTCFRRLRSEKRCLEVFRNAGWHCAETMRKNFHDMLRAGCPPAHWWLRALTPRVSFASTGLAVSFWSCPHP